MLAPRGSREQHCRGAAQSVADQLDRSSLSLAASAASKAAGASPRKERSEISESSRGRPALARCRATRRDRLRGRAPETLSRCRRTSCADKTARGRSGSADRKPLPTRHISRARCSLRPRRDGSYRDARRSVEDVVRGGLRSAPATWSQRNRASASARNSARHAEISMDPYHHSSTRPSLSAAMTASTCERTPSFE